jgi:hypothetical protein
VRKLWKQQEIWTVILIQAQNQFNFVWAFKTILLINKFNEEFFGKE